jgi:Trp operon repressor
VFREGDAVRRRFVTEALLKLMRELEADGLTRRQIAQQLNLDAATITRHLGSVRVYRGARLKL